MTKEAIVEVEDSCELTDTDWESSATLYTSSYWLARRAINVEQGDRVSNSAVSVLDVESYSNNFTIYDKPKGSYYF